MEGVRGGAGWKGWRVGLDGRGGRCSWIEGVRGGARWKGWRVGLD